jgi:hypothetical protein
MDELIMLHPEVDADGRVQLFDQHGRQLNGVRAISVEAKHDDVTQLHITCLSYIKAAPVGGGGGGSAGGTLTVQGLSASSLFSGDAVSALAEAITPTK